jgi:hypothetical protein
VNMKLAGFVARSYKFKTVADYGLPHGVPVPSPYTSPRNA